MHTRARILLGALVAALALSAAVGTASARRFQLSNQTFRVVWPLEEPLIFEEGGAAVQVKCQVTIEGSFHSRTLSKVCGQLVGFVTQARVKRPCIEGAGWALNGIERLPNGNVPATTLPWHIRYNSFVGTLPSITRIRLQLVGAAFLVRIAEAIGCLFRSTAAGPAFGSVNVEGAGTVTGLTAEPSAIPLFAALENPGLCPVTGSFRGTGSATVQNSATRITVRLVQ